MTTTTIRRPAVDHGTLAAHTLPEGKPISLFLQEILDARYSAGEVEFREVRSRRFVTHIVLVAPIDLGDSFHTILTDRGWVMVIAAVAVDEVREGVFEMELSGEVDGRDG